MFYNKITSTLSFYHLSGFGIVSLVYMGRSFNHRPESSVFSFQNLVGVFCKSPSSSQPPKKMFEKVKVQKRTLTRANRFFKIKCNTAQSGCEIISKTGDLLFANSLVPLFSVGVFRVDFESNFNALMPVSDCLGHPNKSLNFQIS